MFTEVSQSRVSVSPEVCSRASEAAEFVSVSSSVSSSIRSKVCSRAANNSGSVVVEPVEVSVSPESVASTAANVVGEKIEKTEASVAVEVVELRKRNLQVEEKHGSSPLELDEEECVDIGSPIAAEGNKRLRMIDL